MITIARTDTVGYPGTGRRTVGGPQRFTGYWTTPSKHVPEPTRPVVPRGNTLLQGLARCVHRLPSTCAADLQPRPVVLWRVLKNP